MKDELISEVADFFRKTWTERDGKVVPTPQDIALGNDSVDLFATVLYADLAYSTFLVDSESAWFSAEIYKAYLTCAARIIKAQSGVITAYDGDRIMAVYIGGSKNTNAVRSALQIRYALDTIINPCLRAQYGDGRYTVQHVAGIDTSPLKVARIGVKNDNDLVWVGRAANHAAKLSSLGPSHSTVISKDVHEAMSADLRGTNEQRVWEMLTWKEMNGVTVYGSNWHFPID